MVTTYRGRLPFRFAATVSAGATLATCTPQYSIAMPHDVMLREISWRIYKGPNLTLRLYIDVLRPDGESRNLLPLIGKAYIDGDDDSPEFKNLDLIIRRGEKMRIRQTNSSANDYNYYVNGIIDFSPVDISS